MTLTDAQILARWPLVRRHLRLSMYYSLSAIVVNLLAGFVLFSTSGGWPFWTLAGCAFWCIGASRRERHRASRLMTAP